MLNQLNTSELTIAFALAISALLGLSSSSSSASRSPDGVSVPDTSNAPGSSPTALPVLPSGDTTVVFPEVRGSNLEGREFTFPADFEGDLNLVFIAFQREQQALVDTWLPSAKDLAGRHAGLRYYELPTIYEANSVVRWFINNGMRRGIPDRTARETTITLYLDKETFRGALNLPHEETIYVLLVDAEGRVVWRTDGAHTSEKELEMERVVTAKLPSATD